MLKVAYSHTIVPAKHNRNALGNQKHMDVVAMQSGSLQRFCEWLASVVEQVVGEFKDGDAYRLHSSEIESFVWLPGVKSPLVATPPPSEQPDAPSHQCSSLLVLASHPSSSSDRQDTTKPRVTWNRPPFYNRGRHKIFQGIQE
eukprot:6183945-Pleurochrysis_carterae.AAC.7